jgi:hypothetical protein
MLRPSPKNAAAHLSYFTFVKLLFGDAVDAIENLLVYSTKPTNLETNENESLRAGELNNSKMPLKEPIGLPRHNNANQK